MLCQLLQNKQWWAISDETLNSVFKMANTQHTHKHTNRHTRTHTHALTHTLSRHSESPEHFLVETISRKMSSYLILSLTQISLSLFFTMGCFHIQVWKINKQTQYSTHDEPDRGSGDACRLFPSELVMWLETNAIVPNPCFINIGMERQRALG